MAEVKDQVKLKNLVVGSQSPDVSTGKAPGIKISDTNVSYFNQSIAQLRQAGQTLAAVRTLARINGDTSATVSAMVRLANTPLKLRVFDDQHQLSEEGSQLLRSIITRFNYSFDYTLGFDGRLTLSELVEALLRSVPLTGAVAAELVLDKTRLPFTIKPVPVEKVQWVTSTRADGIAQLLFPRIVSQKGNIDLDIPTFFYSRLDNDPFSAYTYSPLEPAVNMSIFYTEIVEDIRKVVTLTGHSRLVVKLNYDELVKSAPLDVKSNAQELNEWVEGVRSDIQKQIEGLQPTSALVTFTSVETEYLNSQIGGASDYTHLMQTIDAILATSLKTPSSILGKPSAGSQNTASVESLLFLKTASAIQKPVEALLAQALTLACRLVGFMGYVKVEFSEISLRPEIENEAFLQMRQARVLEQLSLGFIGDAEAGELLGTGALSPTFTPLSGTGFYGAKQGSNDNPNPNDSPATRAPNPTKGDKSPKSGGGKDQATRK